MAKPKIKKSELNAVLGRVAGAEFSLRGYNAFYQLIFNRPPPDHVKKWIVKLMELGERGSVRALIEAFRGSTKSTSMIALLAFFIGHFPHLTNLVIGAGDDDAKEICAQVARIIRHNPGWALCFEHVKPSEDGVWGADSGYDVWDTHMEYGEWVRMQGREGRAPTFKGVGYQSAYLPGPHPTGMLLIDDIHNEKNTISERELRRVKTIYQGTIIPMLEPETWHLIIGTPWTYSDIIAMVKETGVFEHIQTPVYTEGKPTWEEKFDEEYIQLQRKSLFSEIEFARMYLLDLEKTRGLVLKKEWLHEWPYEELREGWPAFIGVDYTSTADPRKQRGDYFALAVGRAIPGGRGLVIEEGVRERISQAEAEDMVVAWARKYPTLQALGIEAIITGNEFLNMLLNNAELRGQGIVPTPVRFGQSKGHRFEKLMAPMFQKARVYISDKENEFLAAFRNEWMNWQGDALEKAYPNDTMDAVYSLLDVAQFFVAPIPGMKKKVTNPLFEQAKKINPFARIGRQ